MDNAEQKSLIFLPGDRVIFKKTRENIFEAISEPDKSYLEQGKILTVKEERPDGFLTLKEDSSYEYYSPNRFEHCNTVAQPSHYNFGKFEVINVLEDWDLDFHLGNVIKYIARAKHKGNFLQDLEKALWYLNRRIEIEKRKV